MPLQSDPGTDKQAVLSAVRLPGPRADTAFSVFKSGVLELAGAAMVLFYWLPRPS